jgi:hypothetical protein
MGFIIETQDELLGLERRLESYGILDLQRKPYGSGNGPDGISAHVFAYEDGAIEFSNDFLNRLLRWFEQHPQEREDLKRFSRI